MTPASDCWGSLENIGAIFSTSQQKANRIPGQAIEINVVAPHCTALQWDPGRLKRVSERWQEWGMGWRLEKHSGRWLKKTRVVRRRWRGAITHLPERVAMGGQCKGWGSQPCRIAQRHNVLVGKKSPEMDLWSGVRYAGWRWSVANTWCGCSLWALWVCGNLKGVAQGRDAFCTLFLELLS